jgi:protein SCO1/2
MTKNPKVPSGGTWLLLLATVLVAAVAGVWLGFRLVPTPKPPLATTEQVQERRDFSLTDSNGKKVTLATYQGKWMLMFFGFTACPEACPLAMQLVSTTLGEMGETGKTIQPVFVSIDPARDTPEVLKEYLAHFSDNIAGLSGTAEETAAIAKAYGVFYRRRAIDGVDYTMDHSTALYLIAPDGRYIRPFRADVDPSELAEDLALTMKPLN